MIGKPGVVYFPVKKVNLVAVFRCVKYPGIIRVAFLALPLQNVFAQKITVLSKTGLLDSRHEKKDEIGSRGGENTTANSLMSS